MKRKMLLAFLPALLVLSSCGVKPSVKAEPNFYEDTLAHEEIFDNVGSLSPRKANDAQNDYDVSAQPRAEAGAPVDPIVDPSGPSIGIQTHVDGSSISIRFVGAVTLTEGEEAGVSAVWTRTMYNALGDAAKATAQKPCKTAYTALKDGDSTLTIEQFNAFRNTSYTHFVVYTMLDIPDTYSSWYLNAFLTVDGASSKAVSTTVDQSIQTTFDSSYTYFLRGTIGGVQQDLPKDAVPAGDNENDHASFSYNFKVNDSFKLVISTPSEYKIIDASFDRLIEGGSQSGWKNHYFSNNNGAIKINFKANYVLYLNEDDNFYFGVSGVSRPLYVSVKDVTWWGDGRLTGIWAFNNDTNVEARWFSLTKCSDKPNCFVTSEDVDASVYKSIDVVEMKAGVSQLSWGENNANVNNKTSDYDIPGNGINNNCAYIWGNTNPWNIGWGEVPANNA